MTRTNVFICYSPEDKEWLERLQTMLKPLENRQLIEVWNDTRIQAGSPRKEEINRALEKAKIAVLLVSASFLASSIVEEQLNKIFKLEKEKRLRILWIYISSCSYDSTSINDYEPAHQPLKPLNSLQKPQWQTVLLDISKKIEELAAASGTSSNLFSSILKRKNIWKNYSNSEFIKLERREPRSPLELTKEIPQADNILPLLAEIPRLPTIPDQIEYVQKKHYADIYSDSWAEQEAELIGLWMLRNLTSYKDGFKFKDMYDAGCANFGQFKAIMNMDNIDHPFCYYAQDFNPDWEVRFPINKGQFYLMPLPLVPEEINCGLVACNHTLHFLAQHPIAIYTTVFSFNTLLTTNGLCYITVPEKESQPGMLDLLERAAVDGHFDILESGRCRLLHHLTEQSSQNITTFLYLLLRKKDEVDVASWRNLIGVSFLRSGYKEGSKRHGVINEADIPDYIRLLEMDLQELFAEQNRPIRAFRHALVIAYGKRASGRMKKDYEQEIRSSIQSIHDLLVKNSRHSLDGNKELSEEAARYLVCLAGWYIAGYSSGSSIVKIANNVCPIVERVLKNPTDIRVHLNDLSSDQIARLIKHLFELCEFVGIDIRISLDQLA